MIELITLIGNWIAWVLLCGFTLGCWIATGFCASHADEWNYVVACLGFLYLARVGINLAVDTIPWNRA